MTVVLRNLLTNRLALRLVIASLVVGSVLSVFSTGLQLAASFNQQRQEATQVFDRTDRITANVLEQAVWTFNNAQVEIILDGLIADQNVGYVALATNTGQVWTKGKTQPDAPSKTFDLVHTFDDGNTTVLGTLQVQLTLETVINRVWAQFWTTFLTNIVKAYLAAAALLFIVYRLINRHLHTISQYVGTRHLPGDAMLQLDRPKHRAPDDIDHIVSAITRYEDRTQEQVNTLLREVKDRERAEAEAKRALSVRSSFLATMSHEIRTPLNAIMGFLHLIESHADTPAKPKLYATTATKAAHQLLDQLNNTLDMSRLEAQAVEIKRAETDLPSLGQTWLENARADAHNRNRDIDISLTVDPDVPQTAIIDGPHVTQIINNLTNNAIKFTHKGRVEIVLRKGAENDTVDILVRDTGAGIPETARTSIFLRFNQAENGLARPHGGTGLGLAISRELAQLMGADLTLYDAELDGFSTTFLLRLRDLSRVDHGNDVSKQSASD